MHVGTETATDEHQQQPAGREPQADSPTVSRDGERIESFGVARRSLYKSLCVRIAANDLVEDDDVCRLEHVGQIDEVAFPVIGPLSEALLTRLRASFLEHLGRQIDTDGTCGSGTEELLVQTSQISAIRRSATSSRACCRYPSVPGRRSRAGLWNVKMRVSRAMPKPRSSGDSMKSALYQQIARVAQALGNDGRLQLLEYVTQGERSVEELARMTKLSVANCSKHLQVLRQAGLVVARKKGLRVYYGIAGDDVAALFVSLRLVAEHRVAEIERMLRNRLGQRDPLAPVPASELLRSVKQGLVTVLDVRPAEEFIAGHLPGAINVPIDKLERFLAKLPKDKELVAYCRGPYCLMSYDAVEKLRKHGWRTRRLEDGFPEWRAAGLPVRHGGQP